jgi:ABC-type bacteriocin/lantibiotic exporter with double-glycine peptidase domain
MTIEPEEKPSKVSGAFSDHNAPLEVDRVPAGWPRTGAVEFRNVTVRYDVDGQDILKDINLTFEAGERVAVIGRTGSGKSTVCTEI